MNNRNQNRNPGNRNPNTTRNNQTTKGRQQHRQVKGNQDKNTMEATQVAHKVSFGSLTNLNCGQINHVITANLVPIINRYGFGRIGGICLTENDDETKVSVTIRPTEKHAQNGQAAYTQKVAARKPNLFTLLNKTETGEWTMNLDSRDATALQKPWHAVLVKVLTGLIEKQQSAGKFMGALLLPESAAKTKYNQVLVTKPMIAAIKTAVHNQADHQQFKNLMVLAVNTDTVPRNTQQGNYTQQGA